MEDNNQSSRRKFIQQTAMAGVMNYCAKNEIYPQIQIIKAGEINDAWEKVVNKQARYRYVIDEVTI
jgi:D-arabinose 1-dehydrogenase-like Zn-dependent alcohol dehydrogenase